MGSCFSKNGQLKEPQPAHNNKAYSRRTQGQKAGEDVEGGQVEKTRTNAVKDDEKRPQQTVSPKSKSSNQGRKKVVKVLLLGSGESGKSTFVKQMKILYQNGYTTDELLEYKPFVYRNVLDCIKSVIAGIIDVEPELIKPNEPNGALNKTTDESSEIEKNSFYENDNVDGEQRPKRKHVLEYNELNDVLDYEYNNENEVFDPVIAQYIKKIYNTPEVQWFIKYEQSKFYLIDSTNYFLPEIDRIADPNYITTVDDALRTRKKTSGIYDLKFEVPDGMIIHMFDVGGQRSERKKWIYCFDNVTLIIFCVALSEYDQVLLEENSENRLEESLILFDSVVNSRWFSRTSIVLFLNKIDVLVEKLPYSPLEKHFRDYSGGNNVNKAVKYILWKFTQVNRSGLNIYPHVTQATNTSNINLVFAAIRETILENNLKDSGIL